MSEKWERVLHKEITPIDTCPLCKRPVERHSGEALKNMQSETSTKLPRQGKEKEIPGAHERSATYVASASQRSITHDIVKDVKAKAKPNCCDKLIK